jgi:hypothetical protein
VLDESQIDVPQRRPRPRWWVFVRKFVVVLIGIPVVVLGLVMLVTQGPGLPVLIAGLAILSVEFEWAQRQVDRLKDTTRKVFKGGSRADGEDTAL